MSYEALASGSHLFSHIAELMGLDIHTTVQAIVDQSENVGTGFTELYASVSTEIERLTHLGDDPVGVPNKPGETPIDAAYEGSDPDMDPEQDMSPIMQAARAIADEGNFSPAKRAAFLDYVQDHRADMKAVTVENGQILLMADGAKGDYHAKLFETALPEHQRDAVGGSFRYFENGVWKEEKVIVMKDCSNLAVYAGEDALVPPPEVEVVPEQPTEPQPWRQFMVCSGGAAEYYYGFTLTDKGGYSTWEEAAQAYVRDTYGPSIPKGAPECVIVRVDDDGDGIPEKVFQVNRTTGAVSDLTVTVNGEQVNVSTMDPREQDLVLTGSHDSYQVTADPTESKPGKLKSTPNPLDTLTLKDGTLYGGGESYEGLVDKHMDIFVQDVLQVDTKDTPHGADPIESAGDVPGAEGVQKLLETPASEVMSMSRSELASRFGLTTEQADNAYDALHRTESRSGVSPEVGESTEDYLRRAFSLIVQSPR